MHHVLRWISILALSSPPRFQSLCCCSGLLLVDSRLGTWVLSQLEHLYLRKVRRWRSLSLRDIYLRFLDNSLQSLFPSALPIILLVRIHTTHCSRFLLHPNILNHDLNDQGKVFPEDARVDFQLLVSIHHWSFKFLLNQFRELYTIISTPIPIVTARGVYARV